MTSSSSSVTNEELLRSRMLSLRERFRARTAEDRQAMIAAWVQRDRGPLRERSHRLAGVAATFGYPAIGAAAKSLEDLIKLGVPDTEVDVAAKHLFGLLELSGLDT